MERFVPHSFRSLMSFVLAIAIASQTLAFYPSVSEAAKLSIPLPSRKTIMVCSLLLTTAWLTENAGGPVASALPQITISQPVANAPSKVVTSHLLQAQNVIRAANTLKVTEILGAPESTVSESQAKLFRGEWIKLVEANVITGTIPSRESYTSWWIQNEDLIFKSKKDFSKDMTMQSLFMHTATVYMVESHPAQVVVAWSEKIQANQALNQASPESTSWLAWFMTLAKGIAIGALAAGPVGNLLNLAIEPGFRSFRVKWQKAFENIWAFFNRNKSEAKPDAIEVSEPDTELTPEQIRRESREKLSRIQRTRAQLNGLGYTAKPRALMVWETAKQLVWDQLYKNWQNVYTGTQRDGRDKDLDSSVFRPTHFADRTSAALDRAENSVQGYESVRRDVLIENPKNVDKIRTVLDELSENIHDMKYYQYRSQEESEKYSANIEKLKEQLLGLGASPEQVSRLVQTRTYVYIHKRNAVFNLFAHLKHENHMTEFYQGIPPELLREIMEMRTGLGLDDFHREFSAEVVAVAQELDYDLAIYENPLQAYIALLDEPQRPIVKDKPIVGPVKRPIKR